MHALDKPQPVVRIGDGEGRYGLCNSCFATNCSSIQSESPSFNVDFHCQVERVSTSTSTRDISHIASFSVYARNFYALTHVSGAQILLIIVNKGNPVVFSTKKNVCILVDSTVQLFDTQSLARGLFYNERLLCSRPSPPLA